MKGFLKKWFGAKSLRAGGYSTFALAMVIALAVAVNLLASALPTTATQLDFTENEMYSLSEQTERIVKALDKDVTIYLIASSGSEDSRTVNLLKRYAALSSHLKVETIDPVEYPTFAKQYTSETVQSNSAVVVCGERYRYVDYNDIYQQVESEDYDTYYQYVYYYGYTQYYDYLYDWVFAGENAFTSAVSYVTSEDLPKMYILSGHSEAQLSDSFAAALSGENFDTETISLLNYETLPEDADAVLLYAPQTDISSDEAEMLITYLDDGGNILLITDYIADGEMTNLLAVCAHMGMKPTNGIVIDGDSNRYYRSPYNLLPEIQSSEITDAIKDAGYYILYPIAQGIERTESIGTYTALLTSSEAAFSKVAGYDLKTYEKEDGDTDGPFDVAACVVDGNAHMAWFTSAQFVTDSVNQMVSGANQDLFLNALNWMAAREDKISIRAKSLDTSYLTVSTGDKQLWSILLIGAIPAALIAIGVCVIVRRKRR